MKYITFTIPCYNSQDYMRKCIDSILVGGEDVEIIIVNDGSKDNTIAIANEYAEKYPSIVRVVDKENGGHGSGVNAGLRLATGLYYKVVDSDDWVDEQSLKKLLETVKTHATENCSPDLYVVNYVYEHVEDNTQNVRRYKKQFPTETFCDWSKVGKFRLALMFMMHSLVYRTDVLRQIGLVLPEHTFYVDIMFAYNPLPCVKSIYYLDIDFYRYFIGRSDQSVNINNMVKRYEQMARVMQLTTDAWTYEEIKSQPRGLRRYMIHALANHMMIAHLMICGADSPERRESFKNMWQHIKERDIKLYKKLRYRTYVILVTKLPWKTRGWCLVNGYKLLSKIVKLG